MRYPDSVVAVIDGPGSIIGPACKVARRRVVPLYGEWSARQRHPQPMSLMDLLVSAYLQGAEDALAQPSDGGEL